MKRIYLLLLALFAITFTGLNAQIITTSPPVLQRGSQNIVITYHADTGNKALSGLPSTTNVYAHTGVILQGQSDSQWSAAPTWGDNSAKYLMTYVSPNTYTLTINNIQEYYGLTATQASQVNKLAFVFRNSDGSLQGKTASGGDIFVNVYPDNELAMVLTPSVEAGIVASGTTVSFTVNTTENSTITLYNNDVQFATVDNSATLTGDLTISSAGNNIVTAIATSNGTTVTQQLTYVVATAPIEATYPGGVPQMGAVKQSDGSTLFCIAAPGKQQANIFGSWNDYLPSDQTYYQDYQGNRYFWWSVPMLIDGVNYIYFYQIDGIQVGDPYARLVLDQSNDQYISSDVYPNMPQYPSQYVTGVPVAVYNSTADTYDWKVKNFKGVDKDRLVIYELLIRDFTGTEGKANGNGTIAGVMSKLDYIQSLGVNAVELLPIMEFNGNNSWGYNPNFYFAPDKAYGTPDAYRELIDALHERGIAVILDIVFNQTDGQHPWYQLYPIASNPFYNGTAPHSYSVLNDWKQENPLVQQQFKDALKYWLEAYNVDGFRFDLVKGLGNDDSYNATYNSSTNSFTGVTEAKTNAYNASRVARMKELHSAMKEVNPDAYFINENLAGEKEENEMAEDGELNWANVNYASTQFASGYSSGANMNRFYAPNDSRTLGSTVSYAESHDEERMAYSVSKTGAKGIKGNTEMTMRRLGSVAAIMLMTPGSHMIWQFQELGDNQTTKNSSGNDTSPKKVIWDSYMKSQYRVGLKDTYAALNDIRNNNPTLFGNSATVTMNCNTINWATGYTIALSDGTKELYCVVNPDSTATKSIEVPFKQDASKYQVIANSYNTTPSLNDNIVTLPAGAFVIYATANVAGIDNTVTDLIPSVKVISGVGEITIAGDYKSVEVYNLSGQRINRLKDLQSGIYAVIVDGKSYKVAVK